MSGDNGSYDYWVQLKKDGWWVQRLSDGNSLGPFPGPFDANDCIKLDMKTMSETSDQAIVARVQFNVCGDWYFGYTKDGEYYEDSDGGGEEPPRWDD